MASVGLSASCNGFGDTELAAIEIGAPHDGMSPEDNVMQLFGEMRAPLLHHLTWLNLHMDQAEDAIQETFLRLYQQLKSNSLSRHNLRGWVWRVAHNLGIDMRTAANRQKQSAELDLGQIAGWLVDPGPSPEQTFQQRQCERKIGAAIRQLNERDRKCLRLRVQGHGYRQIASMMGMGKSTVVDTVDRVTVLLRSCCHS